MRRIFQKQCCFNGCSLAFVGTALLRELFSPDLTKTTLFSGLLHWICENSVVPATVNLGSQGTALFGRL